MLEIKFNIKENIEAIKSLKDTFNKKIKELSNSVTTIADKLSEKCRSLVHAFKLTKKTVKMAFETVCSYVPQSREIGEVCKKLNIGRKEWNSFPAALQRLLLNLNSGKEFNVNSLGEDKLLGKGGNGFVYAVGDDKKYVIKISKNAVENNNNPVDNEYSKGDDLIMGRIKDRNCSGLYVDGVDFVTKYYGTTSGKIQISDDSGPDTRHISIYERADGIDGEKFLASEAGKNLSFAQRLSIADQVAKSIATLHSVGVVHQDIKPENMQIYCQGDDIRVKLIDFGTANTRTTAAAGTPLFNPGADMEGIKKDVYAYGLSMLFNFFPDKREEIEAFMWVLNHPQSKKTQFPKLSTISTLINDTYGVLNAEPNLEELKKELEAIKGELASLPELENDADKNSKETSQTASIENSRESALEQKKTLEAKKMKLEQKIKFHTPGRIIWPNNFFTIDKTAETINKLLDFLNENSKYDAKTITFLKEFFKQTIISENSPSMDQISQALKDFNEGILDSGKISMEGIFNKAKHETPKHIPNYLFQVIEKTEKDLKGSVLKKSEHQQAFEFAKQELFTFMKQNPDMISQEDKIKLEKLGISLSTGT